MLGVTVAMAIFSAGSARTLVDPLSSFLGKAHSIPTDGDGLIGILATLGIVVAVSVALPFFV